MNKVNELEDHFSDIKEEGDGYTVLEYKHGETTYYSHVQKNGFVFFEDMDNIFPDQKRYNYDADEEILKKATGILYDLRMIAKKDWQGHIETSGGMVQV